MPSSRSSSSSESRPSLNIKRSYSTKKESMNGPLYRQTVNRTVLVRRLKRKGDGPSKQLARWFVENQIGTNLPTMPSIATSIATQPTPFPGPDAVRCPCLEENFCLETSCCPTRPTVTTARHAAGFLPLCQPATAARRLWARRAISRTLLTYWPSQVSPSTSWPSFSAPITSSRDPRPTPPNSSPCKSIMTGRTIMVPASTMSTSSSSWL